MFPDRAAASEAARFDFGRSEDVDFDGRPDGWTRREGPGYPRYVTAELIDVDGRAAAEIREADATLVRAWRTARTAASRWASRSDRTWFRRWVEATPSLPPSLADGWVDRCYRVSMDGGRFEARSPAIEIDPRLSYDLRVRVRASGIRHDRVTVTLAVLDGSGNVVREHAAPPLGGRDFSAAASATALRRSGATRSESTRSESRGDAGVLPPLSDWIEVRTPSIEPEGVTGSEKVADSVGAAGSEIGRVAVILRVSSGEDGVEDIHALVDFDHIRLHQRPRLDIRPARPHGLFAEGQTVELVAGVSGDGGRRRIEYTVTDHRDRTIAAGETAIGRDGVGRWSIGTPPPGHYRVQVRVRSGTDVVQGRTGVAVYPRRLGDFDWGGREGDPAFGYDLSNHALDAWSAEDFLDAIEIAGVGRVIHPLSTEVNGKAIDSRARMATLPESIQWIGGLSTRRDDPAVDAKSRSSAADGADIRSRFWTPAADRWLRTATGRGRTVVLGRRGEPSWSRRSDPIAKMDDELRLLQGYGPPLSGVIHWPWTETLPEEGSNRWAAVLMSSDPPLNDRELIDALAVPGVSAGGVSADGVAVGGASVGGVSATPRPPAGVRRWLWLAARRDSSDVSRTASDLARRIVATRTAPVRATFVSTDDLFADDGTPRPHWVACRTAMAAVRGTRLRGRLERRSGVENVVLEGPQGVVWVVWNSWPVDEEIYLGEGVVEVDLWGRHRSLDRDGEGASTKTASESFTALRRRRPSEMSTGTPGRGGRRSHRLRIGPEPKFYLGCDPELMGLRLGTRWSPQRLDSLLGIEQPAELTLINPTRHPLPVAVDLWPPTSWTIQPSRVRTELPSSDRGVTRGTVVLGNAAESGRHWLPIDVTLLGDRPRTIRIERPVDVGPPGLDVHAAAWVETAGGRPGGRGAGDEPGTLVADIEVSNRTPYAQAYDWLIFPPPQHPYQMRYVVVPAGQTIRRRFRWEGAAETRGGRMLLRASQRDGQRVINHAFDIAP